MGFLESPSFRGVSAHFRWFLGTFGGFPGIPRIPGDSGGFLGPPPVGPGWLPFPRIRQKAYVL